MITSNRRPNWAIRKDRAAKPLLQRTSYSLPPLNEALKKISNVTSHSKPRPNKSRLHQWDRNQPKHMRNDSLDRSRSKQRQSGWRTSTNLRRFASSETQKKGKNEARRSTSLLWGLLLCLGIKKREIGQYVRRRMIQLRHDNQHWLISHINQVFKCTNSAQFDVSS